MLDAIRDGDKSKIDDLIADFSVIKQIFNQQITNELASMFNESDLPGQISEYQKLIAEKPEITDEDMLYI